MVDGNVFIHVIKLFQICRLTSDSHHITCYSGSDDSIVSVHCREEGCIGNDIPRVPIDFPRGGDSAPRGLRDCIRSPYTSERRDLLGNTSLEDREISQVIE